MKLRVSMLGEHVNIDVIRRVLEEFDGENVIELNRRVSCAFLVCRSMSDGEEHSVSVAIPRNWLIDPQRASHVEETTRNFAGRIVEAM